MVTKGLDILSKVQKLVYTSFFPFLSIYISFPNMKGYELTQSRTVKGV